MNEHQNIKLLKRRGLANRSAVFLLVLVANYSIPFFLHASSIPPRKVAKRSAEDSIANVRRYLGTDSSAMAGYLIDMLAIPIGDDPRVLELCKEVLSKSTTTKDMQTVASALFYIVNNHTSRFSSSKRKASIAEPLRQFLTYPDRQIQLLTADSLNKLGGAFREEAVRYYLGLLTTSRPIGSTTDLERSDIYTEAIRRLLEVDATRFEEPIKEATQKYDLLTRFKKWIADDSERRLAFSHNAKFLERWEAVLRQGQQQ